MKIAIIGLSNVGKTTFFSALTKKNIETTIYPSLDSVVHIGIVKVPDRRLETLSEIYQPKKTTFATMEYLDVPAFSSDDPDRKKKIFSTIKESDAIVHVVRTFHNDSVIHPFGSLDTLRDVKFLHSEMIFKDYEFVEKRLYRIEEGRKKGKKMNEEEKKLLLKCKNVLEKETLLRNISFTSQELQNMKSLEFFSIKPELIVLNIGEEDLGKELIRNMENKLKEIEEKLLVLSLCGKIEMEIAQLPDEDSPEFLKAMGIDEPVLFKVIHSTYRLMDLISFLTVGKDEVRAWTIPNNTEAQKAARKVHSDIEKGFIRAEVISYEDFLPIGNMVAAREAGLVRLEGKKYLVKDGDIINFRFNV